MTERTPVPGYYVSQNPKRRPGSAVDDRWTNPILDRFRDSWDSGDVWGSALLALGALQDYEPGDFVSEHDVANGIEDGRLLDLSEIWEELLDYDAVDGDTEQNQKLSLEQFESWTEHARKIMDRLADLAKLAGRDY